MNTGTPSTGLKHAQFLVNLYLSYMGHDWAHHRWRLFLKNERKITTGKGFFCSFVHIFFTGGLPADGITAMVVKECCLFIYCVRLSMAPQLQWSYL